MGDRTVAGTLRVMRESFGIELQRGVFDVVVDGRSVGTIEKKEDALETPLEPGHHTVRVRKGRYSSQERSFYAGDRRDRRFPLLRGQRLAALGGLAHRAKPGDLAHASVARQAVNRDGMLK